MPFIFGYLSLHWFIIKRKVIIWGGCSFCNLIKKDNGCGQSVRSLWDKALINWKSRQVIGFVTRAYYGIFHGKTSCFRDCQPILCLFSFWCHIRALGYRGVGLVDSSLQNSNWGFRSTVLIYFVSRIGSFTAWAVRIRPFWWKDC